MTEHTAARIGIVASIIGAVGALAYLFKKTAPIGTPGESGAPWIGLPGPASLPGLDMAADSPAGAGAAGGPAVSPAEITPDHATINQYFNQQFSSDGPYPNTVIQSNLPPASSWPRGSFEAPAPPLQKGGCGCSGAVGCNGGGCRTGR